MTPRYCVDCDNVHPATRSSDPWRWRCLVAPVKPGFKFVHPGYSPEPPYEKCERINTDGACGYFVPLRSEASHV